MTEISEVPNIGFIGNASNITENDGILTVCAVAGQLVQEFTPVNVVISTSSGVAKGNILFIGITPGRSGGPCPPNSFSPQNRRGHVLIIIS